MVWNFIKKLFGNKEEDEGYEEVSQEEVEKVVKKTEKKSEPVKEEPKKVENKVHADNKSFTRYVCGKCFKWSDFKSGTLPSSCPHCGNRDKTTFKAKKN